MKFSDENRNFSSDDPFDSVEKSVDFFLADILGIAEGIPLDVVPVDPSFRPRPLEGDVFGLQNRLDVRHGLRDDRLKRKSNKK